MEIEKISENTVKMTFRGEEAESVEKAVQTFDTSLSSKLMVIWLVTYAQNECGIKIGRNLTVELIKDRHFSALYFSSYTHRYYLTKNSKGRTYRRKQNKLVCEFNCTDKLIKFAKFINAMGYRPTCECLYGSNDRLLLEISGNIPEIILCEYCDSYRISKPSDNYKSFYTLIRRTGCIKAISEL